MVYIMDMANGTEHPVEEPSYQVVRETRLAPRDMDLQAGCLQPRLAMVEIQAQTKARTLPAASVDALLKTFED
ncbi:hypothetical protein MNBD_GAMMA14-758 [hydrothermal vent metagenome]|uniref:Uncharacterized protein n=1 Tax=hydrothermal vent metagenome TaxID=652676 RepID=A0A3B0Y8T2_9ZZZZ